MDDRPILIIGSEGSMGRRYQAILSHLKVPFSSVEKHHSPEYLQREISSAGKFILCTPTENHFSYLERLLPLGKPILCEKPITKSLRELDKILSLALKHQTIFNMTFQYSELVPPSQSEAASHYHYFRSGADGLYWDCLQIIALARGEVKISNNSPIWKCMINGFALSLADMDGAYVSFLEKWLSSRILQSADMLFQIHEKTENFRNGAS